MTETFLCSCCEERILNHQNAGDDASPLCQHCFEHHYLNCDRCGALIRRDDANYLTSDSEEPFCYDCYCQESRESAIHDYNYKPEPLFYGDGERYFGIELEIDGGGERSAPAEEILSIANTNDELIYCKHGGSLNSGFEIATHPMTLGFYCNAMPWQALLQRARSLRLHQSSSQYLRSASSCESFCVGLRCLSARCGDCQNPLLLRKELG